MFFGKHHIVIFREGGEGKSRKFRVRFWLIWIIVLIVCGFMVGNVFLLKEFYTNRDLQSQIQDMQSVIDEQNAQYISILGKIRHISQDLLRVERFDAKIRHMLDLNSKLGTVEKSRNDQYLSSALPLHRPNLMARRMQRFLQLLAEDIQLEEVNQQELLQALRIAKDKLSTSPSIWPLRGRINSHFGYRIAPFGRGRRFHKGIDIKGKVGQPIVASAMGTVTQAGFDGAYGIVVTIEHGGGFMTKYAHMQAATVKVGQKVKRGDVIGRVGMTGRTTGPHLHYEVRVGGVPANPMKYMLD